MKRPTDFKIVRETLMDETTQYRVKKLVTKRKFPNFWETEQVWVYVADYDGWTESPVDSFRTQIEAEKFVKELCREYYKQVASSEEI